MDKTDIIFDLAKILGCEARKDEPLSRHTTFKIGGTADAYIKVTTLSSLSAILKECEESDIDYLILGNGSNVLVSDDGYRGVVIRLDGDFRKISLVDDTTIYCGAGATLAALSKFALKCGLTGLEFAWGIPGTVGGAVFMNAGAYGGEMKDVVKTVRAMDPDGTNTREICAEDMQFSYRHSRAQDEGFLILSAEMELTPDDPSEIAARVAELAARRNAKQPVAYPSAGSTFKRPVGGYAAALIEQSGLKGFRVGGAEVSEKHSGFVINTGGATCEDVLAVMRCVREKVFEDSGILLEPEVRLINCSL